MSVRIYLLSVFSFLICMGNLQAQEENNQFRRDYNYYSGYDGEKWTEWERTSVTLVFNYGVNSDVLKFTANGERTLYRRVSNVENSSLENGEKCQFITVLDENGNMLEIQLFENPDLGVKLIYGNFAIQLIKGN